MGVATDWAWSETYAWGEGLYGNFSLRLGHRPWRFSLAGDGVGGRFADRSGSSTTNGLRFAARGEYFWPRSGLLRFQGNLRSSGPDFENTVFDRGSFSVYYRPSAPTAAERRENTKPVRFSRASLSLGRDARNTSKTTDSLSALAAFTMGPFSTAFNINLNNKSALPDEGGNLFQFPMFENFESLKLGGEFIWRAANLQIGNFVSAGNLELRNRIGYTIRAEKDPILDFSVNCSFRPGRWGRVSLRIASTDFPEKWNYTLGWRFQKR